MRLYRVSQKVLVCTEIDNGVGYKFPNEIITTYVICDYLRFSIICTTEYTYSIQSL